MSLIYLQTLILSLIQGISEFIPVSSSAHLVLFQKFLTSYKSSVLMDASLHLGSLIAIIHYFLRDLINFSNNKKNIKFTCYWFTAINYNRLFFL